jgi:hypothetical protein
MPEGVLAAGSTGELGASGDEEDGVGTLVLELVLVLGRAVSCGAGVGELVLARAVSSGAGEFAWV